MAFRNVCFFIETLKMFYFDKFPPEGYCSFASCYCCVRAGLLQGPLADAQLLVLQKAEREPQGWVLLDVLQRSFKALRGGKGAMKLKWN